MCIPPRSENMTREPWFIPPSDFLGRMAADDRASLLHRAQRRVIGDNGFVFQAGSPGSSIHILVRGRVKIYGLSSLGKAVILWFCFPGEIFGLAEMPRGGRREVYAQACGECEVASVPQQEFKEFLVQHPSTAMLVIELLACRLRTLGDMLINLTADDVTTRLVKLLLRLAARYGRPGDDHLRLDIALTHQEISDMIGATRQTVTAALNDLKRRGILEIQNHRICIPNREALERLAGGETAGLPPLGARAFVNTPAH